MSAIRTAATLYGLLVFAIIACALMAFGIAWLVARWRAVAVVPRDGFDLIAKLQSCGLADRPAIDQRDLGDETDIAAEGLGWNVPLGDLVHDRIIVRPPDRRREKYHPLGHRTEPLAYLQEVEWKLWTAVIAESAR